MEQKKKAHEALKRGGLFLALVLNFACVPQEETPEKKDDEETISEEVGSGEGEGNGSSENPPSPNPSEENEESPANYLDAASFNGSRIDSYYSGNELLKSRTLVNEDKVDRCNSEKNFYSNDQFADQIHYYTELMIKPVPARVGVIGSYYGTSSNDNNYYPVSLTSHALCQSTSSSLSKTLRNVPAQSVIDKMNRFATKVNEIRGRYLAGEEEAKVELIQTWGKMFSCLAYSESLSTADQSSSRSVASANAPSGYTRPSGVKFYNDPAQNEASRLNIGLFQFTPNSSGNIKPCLRAWNDIHSNQSSCLVSDSGAKAEMIKILGSSYQSFNTFCGIHKFVQTFSIQVNTTTSSATHPNNSGKSSANRCVSPHFYAGRAYNHFGPLQNSTGSNLNKLFTCIENS